MGPRRLTGALILISWVTAPSLAAAQPSTSGPRVGGFVSGSFGDGGPAPAIGVSGGYRFTALFGLDVDVSYVPKLDFGKIPLCFPDVWCAQALASEVALFRGGSYVVRGSAVSLATSVVAELPVSLRWIRPYLTGGTGVAHVRRQLRDTGFPHRFTITSTGPLVTVGGGVAFPLARGLDLGVDVRYQRIFENEQYRPDIDHRLTLTRLGSSLTYRFSIVRYGVVVNTA